MAKFLASSTGETAHEAENSTHSLSMVLRGNDTLTLHDEHGQAIPLPQSVRDALQQVVAFMDRGQLVEIAGFPEELTPGQAAAFLHIPRAQVLGLIQEGLLSIQNTGRRRRIHLQDVISYQHAKAERMHQGIIEIARISQEMGLYDIPLSSEDVVNLSLQDEPLVTSEQPA